MSATPIDRVAALTVPERVFRMNGLDLPDPARDLEPAQALRLYERQYPHLRRAHLAEPKVEGDLLIYEVEREPVQTKGNL